MKRDIAAGVLLANAIPHVVVGMTGQRCMTPLAGEDSSPRVNLLWAAINAAAGAVLLGSRPWRGLPRSAGDRRRVSVEIGCFAMTAFGMCYELTAGRRKRTAAGSG